MNKYNHEVIICIVNAGFSEAVMDAARDFGARGGTVIRARGTANLEAEKLFQITVQPEKEMVMILVETKIRDDILHALYRAVGLNTPGQGIAFSLPVDSVVGLSSFDNAKAEKPEKKKEHAEEKAATEKSEKTEE